MPIYEYQCEDGHRNEALVKMDGSNAPTNCAELLWVSRSDNEFKTPVSCNKPLTRLLSVGASSFPGADSWR